MVLYQAHPSIESLLRSPSLETTINLFRGLEVSEAQEIEEHGQMTFLPGMEFYMGPSPVVVLNSISSGSGKLLAFPWRPSSEENRFETKHGTNRIQCIRRFESPVETAVCVGILPMIKGEIPIDPPPEYRLGGHITIPSAGRDPLPSEYAHDYGGLVASIAVGTETMLSISF